MRITPILSSLLVLLLLVGCSSPKTPQDMCDCLTTNADAYMAKHPDLTKEQLRRTGNEVMTELITPCKEMSEAIEKRLKEADPAAYTKAQAEMQTCLNTLAAKMEAGAKDDAATAEAKEAAGSVADQAEQDADRLAAQIEAGTEPASTESASADTPTADVSDADWDALLSDYEQYLTQYASSMKKVNRGDVAAGAEASVLTAKINALGERFKGAENHLTPEQATRFAQVQARMMQVMLRAQK